MAPKLYMTDMSPPVRAVLLTAKAIGIELEHVQVDVLNNEQLSPEFVKVNPQHTVPTLDDNGFILWDSHAIVTYLVNKYAKGHALYPEDSIKRAVIDQRLYFDSGVTFPALIGTAKPIRLGQTKTVPAEKIELINEAYGFLEKFLENQNWVVGETTTLADLSLIATITTLDIFVPIAASKYPFIKAWINRCEALPYYSENQVGLNRFKTACAALMK